MMESLRGTLPTRKPVFLRNADTCDPDIATRVFEQPEDFVTGKSIVRRVDGFWRRSRELLKAVYPWKAMQPEITRNPPVTHAVLDHELVPSPAVLNACRKAELNRGELLAVKPIYVVFRTIGPPSYEKMSRSVLEHRARKCESIGLAISSDSAAG